MEEIHHLNTPSLTFEIVYAFATIRVMIEEALLVSTFNISIPVGSVDLDGLATDEDYRREARRLLPDALTRIGEKTAEVAWNELQKSFRGIPGFKGNSSSSERSRFIHEGGQNHRRNASDQNRRALEDYIIQQLREMNRKAG